MHDPLDANADAGSWNYPLPIVLDAEFQDLNPLPTAGERQETAVKLRLEGSREPLVVWPCKGRAVLLVGYDLYPLLRELNLSFRVVEQACAGRAEARMYIVRHYLARHNLSPLWASYLRGLRYLDEKKPHGGARPKAGFASLKTAAALGEIFGLDEATIRRDGHLAAAVNAIVERCGPEAKALLLNRGSGMTHGRILALGRLPPEEQRAAVESLRFTGKLPETFRVRDAPATITLPLEPGRLAETLLRRLGPEQAEAICQAIRAAREKTGG